MKRSAYGQRAAEVTHPVAKKLLQCMEEKKTNLGVSADLTSQKEIVELIHEVGPHICVLKTHVDVIADFTPSFTVELQKLAEKYQFLIFEDRKFADIGQIVQRQYEGGVYRICEWAEIVNAHILPGPGIIEGLKQIGMKHNRGLLLIAQMSSAGNLLTPEYTQQTLAYAQQHADFVMGFIAQTKLTNDPRFLHLTPGVQFANSQDDLGQQYVSVEKALVENQTDVILVGRGIYLASSPREEARRYQECGWGYSV